MVELLLSTIIGPLVVGILLLAIEKWLDKDR
ncbi:MAG: type I toxin-antitoxin system Fst family toxin [Streptococcus orisratti]|nr:type I toxin-antitoxin system Fst family toxin [Streptococcus orisratti]MDY5636411.1 type I toxin-antitoxin system Fst family toxin [Streptococcus orisratti]